MSEQKVTAAIIVVASIAFVSVGWIIGKDMTNKTWQAECVNCDFAGYNQKTGEWQWNDGEKVKEQK